MPQNSEVTFFTKLTSGVNIDLSCQLEFSRRATDLKLHWLVNIDTTNPNIIHVCRYILGDWFLLPDHHCSHYLPGVAYAIDRVMQNCSIIPLQNNSFDASVTNISTGATQQQFILKMKNPQDLFYLDNNFTYTGRVRKQKT